MAAPLKSWLSRPSLLRTVLSQVRLAFRLLRDPCVGMLVKALPFLAAVYVVSPLDFIPDVIPLIGQLDDLGVLAIAIEGFLKLCPSAAVNFHRTAIEAGRGYSPMPAAGRVIDAEWRRES
jgi:uncharacterized membrane protein YkvA (DUF1232 family)